MANKLFKLFVILPAKTVTAIYVIQLAIADCAFLTVLPLFALQQLRYGWLFGSGNIFVFFIYLVYIFKAKDEHKNQHKTILNICIHALAKSATVEGIKFRSLNGRVRKPYR